MVSRFRYATLFLAWRARRAGRQDGAALIPAPGDARPPKYLLYLRSIGNGLAGSLERAWKSADQGLYPAYVRARRLADQARAALAEAERLCAQAEVRRQERGTERNIRALARAARAVETARRRAGRAELRLDAAMARRKAHWSALRARFQTMAAAIDQYMQIYSAANVSARDGNEYPPGLRDETCPRPEMPLSLQTLGWELPAETIQTEFRGPFASA